MHIDRYGNKIYHRKNGWLRMKLHNSGQQRVLGWLDEENRVLTINKAARHLHRPTQSYGFNSTILKWDKADIVKLTCPEGTFHIPVADVLAHGFVPKLFRARGYQHQIYLSLERIQNYKNYNP